MTLPPLPTGHTIGCGIFNGEKLFTADQMRWRRSGGRDVPHKTPRTLGN